MSKHVDPYTPGDSATTKLSFGFWVYLMTDLVLFATLFATYAVFRDSTFGGPGAKELFDLPFILAETLILLTSSFTIGLAMLAIYRQDKTKVLGWLVVTLLLGAGFLGMELYEFNHLIHSGNSWQRSGFLSAYFTLVGTHGLHITAGLIWIVVMTAHVVRKGLTKINVDRLALLSMFWHFLDIVWIFIFTFVYLMGAL